MNSINGADNVIDLRKTRSPELMASIFVAEVIREGCIEEDALKVLVRGGKSTLR